MATNRETQREMNVWQSISHVCVTLSLCESSFSCENCVRPKKKEHAHRTATKIAVSNRTTEMKPRKKAAKLVLHFSFNHFEFETLTSHLVIIVGEFQTLHCARHISRRRAGKNNLGIKQLRYHPLCTIAPSAVSLAAFYEEKKIRTKKY